MPSCPDGPGGLLSYRIIHFWPLAENQAQPSEPDRATGPCQPDTAKNRPNQGTRQDRQQGKAPGDPRGWDIPRGIPLGDRGVLLGDPPGGGAQGDTPGESPKGVPLGIPWGDSCNAISVGGYLRGNSGGSIVRLGRSLPCGPVGLMFGLVRLAAWPGCMVGVARLCPAVS